MTNVVCSHAWIDPADPPIERAVYSPVVGSKRREMKVGRTYVCANCGREFRVPTRDQVLAGKANQ